MNNPAVNDPIQRLSLSERRRWRSAERKTRLEHDAEQLAALQGMAQLQSSVTSMLTEDSPVGIGAPVEMIIDGRRLRAWRVYRPTLAALKEALTSLATVPLLGVGRYGPYWVLTFKLATEPLVVLADRLTLLPDWGGSFGWGVMPSGPVAQLVV